MTNKCTKFEALFTFADEKTFQEHLETCKDCQAEDAKMNAVSELIKEVRPHYLKHKKDMAKLKIACAVFAMCLSATTLGVINFNTDISDTIKYGTTLTAEDLGFPVDAYGFVMVE